MFYVPPESSGSLSIWWLYPVALLLALPAGFWASRRWKDGSMFARFLRSFGVLPLLTFLVAGSLFVRIRLALGHWAYWDSGYFIESSPSGEKFRWPGLYNPQHHGDGFPAHVNSAQMMLLLVLVGSPLLGVFLLGSNAENHKTWGSTKLFAATCAPLLFWWLLDPGGQFDWLLAN